MAFDTFQAGQASFGMRRDEASPRSHMYIMPDSRSSRQSGQLPSQGALF